MLDLACVVIYSVFFISWAFAYESIIFLDHECNLMQSFKSHLIWVWG